MGKRTRTPSQEPVAPNPAPAHSFPVTLEDGTAYTAVTEGLATVLFPRTVSKKDRNGNDVPIEGQVFYNPIQQFNRDLSVLAIKAFGEIFLDEKKEKKAAKKGLGKLRGEETAGGKEGERERGGGRGEEEGKGPMDTEMSTEGTVDGGAEVDTTQVRPTTGVHIAPKFTILDALSATGLRALRYALEIPFVTFTTSNDLDPSASQSILRNIQYNKTHTETIDPKFLPVDKAMSKIRIETANARHHMYSILSPSKPKTEEDRAGSPVFGKYDVIDLDPFGTAAPFLDAAVQAVSDGGLLCITCTDAGVWASTGHSEKCFSLYGGMPVKGEWSHEAGIRLILYATATAAGRYGCAIEPLLSLSVDFYARIFVRVRKSPQEVKRLASTSMIVYNCDSGCGSWSKQSLGKRKEERNKNGNGAFMKYGLAMAPNTGPDCQECGFPMHLGGPMWSGQLHSETFITHLLSTLPQASTKIYHTIPRITGMLQTALQESTLPDSPFFFVTTRLAKTLHCESPPWAAFRGALKGLGWKVVRSHCKPTSVKTDAPWSVIWEVMRRWVKERPIKEGSLNEKAAGYQILRLGAQGKTSVRQKAKMQQGTDEEEALKALKVVFDEELGKDEDKARGVVRYQVNPTANWGPMARGRGVEVVLESERVKEDEEDEDEDEKSEEGSAGKKARVEKSE